MKYTSCECDSCKSACENKPGWFLPGEAEKAATLKGMTLKEFFDKYLSVEYMYGEEREDMTWLLSPAIVGEEPGKEFPANPDGTCVFFTEDGLCSIHDAKPHECRVANHTDSREQGDKVHIAIAVEWEGHQEQIPKLLGREPEEPDFGELMSWALNEFFI